MRNPHVLPCGIRRVKKRARPGSVLKTVCISDTNKEDASPAISQDEEERVSKKSPRQRPSKKKDKSLQREQVEFSHRECQFTCRFRHIKLVLSLQRSCNFTQALHSPQRYHPRLQEEGEQRGQQQQETEEPPHVRDKSVTCSQAAVSSPSGCCDGKDSRG